MLWDCKDDPENSYNWPFIQKLIFCIEIGILSTSVYMGSAIYTPGAEELMEEFSITQVKATLSLTMLVIGYDIGPIFFAPLSANAAFVTGVVSFGDIITSPYIPIGIATWSTGGACGPTLSPLIESVLTVKAGWVWVFWFMCIISGSCVLVLIIFSSKTHGKILFRRMAQRLRTATGNQNIIAEGELENKDLHWGEMLMYIFWRLIVITFIEPAALSINIYLAFVYALLYLWFKVFPIAYNETYGFTLIEMEVSYISIMTAKLLNGETVTPEVFIPIVIFASVLMPNSIFIFAWTGSKNICWIVPLIGACVFAIGSFMTFQSLFNYLSMSFWKYLISAFADSVVFKSIITGYFPLFGKVLNINLSADNFPVG